MIKNYINEIESSLLKELFNVAQTALVDGKTIKRVAKSSGISEHRIRALIPIAIDLSMEQRPNTATEKALEESIRKLHLHQTSLPEAHPTKNSYKK